MLSPYTHTSQGVARNCHIPLALPRHTRTMRCPQCQQVYAHSRNVTQGALRYVKLKAEGLWPMCSVAGCDSEAKTARGAHCAAHAVRLRKGQDMTAPVRKRAPYRGGCSIEGCERPTQARDKPARGIVKLTDCRRFSHLTMRLSH